MMSHSIEILFIGPTDTKDQVGGQIEKNAAFLRFARRNQKVRVVDTSGWLAQPQKVFSLICELIRSKGLIVLSLSSRSAFFVICLCKLLRVDHKVVYLVVGGWFHKMLANSRWRVPFYKGLREIRVQSESMVDSLRELSLTNVRYLPNFRDYDRSLLTFGNNEGEGAQTTAVGFRFLYLSKVSESKGAFRVIRAFDEIVLRYPDSGVSLDFYGTIDEDIRAAFELEIADKPYLNYRGVVDLRDRQGYLKLLSENYSAMVFCTTFEGEGFPGVLLDAMLMRLPVVATNWNFNAEIIQHGVNGLLVTPYAHGELVDVLVNILDEPACLKVFSANMAGCIEQYHAEIVVGEFLRDYSNA